MRVLIVADVLGGVQTFVDELTRELAGRDIEVHLGLLGTSAPDAARAAASCQVRDLKLEWMAQPWRDVELTGEWVSELLCRHRPDLVHMNTFAPVLDPDVPVLLTVHSCVLTWWRAVHGADAPADWSRYRALAGAALERADALCVPTRALRDQLAAVYRDLPAAQVIPNGRALGPAPDVARERLVVSVGRVWDEAKNVHLVADAAPAIDGRVVVIGPGPAPAGVEHLGALAPEAVSAWLARAAVFAEPARYEPFGLAALEAALRGCALVLGDIPSLREVWHDAASYVDPDDVDALTHVVNSLLVDPAKAQRASAAARSRAARYTPSAMAEAYLSAYREVARAAVPA
jgi:glycogen synthase